MVVIIYFSAQEKNYGFNMTAVTTIVYFLQNVNFNEWYNSQPIVI
jgi:hypothetical protein